MDSIRSMEPQLLHRVADSVATVVVHHPAKRNAMTTAMWRALPGLLDGLAADPGVRALVLTGEGATFCAGADISTLRESAEEAQGLAVRAEEALAAFPRPTLAAIRTLRGRRGAVGGGVRPAVRRGDGAVRRDPGQAGGRVSGLRDPAAGGPDRARHREVPAVRRRVDRCRAGTAHRPGGRGAAGGRARQAGGGVHPGAGVAFPADAGRGEGVRRRTHGPGRPLGRPGAGQRRHRGGVAAFLERRQPRFGWNGPSSG